MQPTQTQNPLDSLLTSLRAYGVRKLTIEFADSSVPEIAEIKPQTTKEAPKLPEEMLSGEF